MADKNNESTMKWKVDMTLVCIKGKTVLTGPEISNGQR